MKIDFTQLIRKMDGTPIDDMDRQKITEEGEEGKKTERWQELRLGDVCVKALTTATNNVKDGRKADDLDGATKLKLYVLATMINESMEPGGKQPILKSEEIALLKAFVGVAYIPLVTGQAWQMLERDIEPKQDAPKQEEQ
jgi:hypothetical protein